jgi:hypothetical protein
MAVILNQDTQHNNVDDYSFSLLRTNPALSTNVKLVVDSNGDVFMNSFTADQELSKSKYQKYPINTSNGLYSYDVAKFFGTLPSDVKYKVARFASDYTVYTDYSNQYEMQYSYGASFVRNKIYDEQYRFFAPIWLDKKLPSNFIIYRIDGTKYTTQHPNNIAGQNSRILELLKNATIVKSFDLTRNSKIGRYLKSHIEDPNFPAAPISQNFEVDQYTIFRGIDTLRGGFVDRKENLQDDFTQYDNLEIFSNEVFSNGFQRNQVAAANLINLEFLFDDRTANNYDIYRYFGVYVIPHEEGTFDIDRTVSNDSIEGIYITPGTETTNFNLFGTGLSAQSIIPNQDELKIPSLHWIKSKDNNFYHIRNGETFTDVNFLPVSLNKSNVESFNGKTIIGNVQVENFTDNVKDFIKIEIVRAPLNGDKIFIVPYSELKGEQFNINQFMIGAEDNLPAGTFTNNTYSIFGTLDDISRALVGCLSQSEYGFKVTRNGTSIIIEDYGLGINRKLTIFGIRKGNVSKFITVTSGISEVPSNLTEDIVEDWNIFYPHGGAIKNRMVFVRVENKGDISVGDFVQSSINGDFVKITNIIEDAYDSSLYRIVFEKDVVLPNSKSINIYKKFTTSYGRFQILDIKDFDFDFYDTSNSELNELELESTILTSQEYDKYDASCSFDLTVEHQKYYSNLKGVITEDIINRQSQITNIDEIDNTILFEDNVSSEYNRLFENEIKNTAVLSRIIPTINKFVLKDGFNARMKPYHLSVNESFGTNNLSPSLYGDTRNPDLINMEHFHINKAPLFILANQNNIYKNKSYLDFGIKRYLSFDDLLSSTYDFFSKYMIWNGANSGYVELVDINSVTLSGGVVLTSYIFSGPLYTVNKTIPAGTLIPRAGITPARFNADVTVAANSNIMSTLGRPFSPESIYSLKIGDIVCRSLDINDVSNPAFVKNKREIRYSRFSNGSETNEPSTVFRGLRYIYKKRKESNSAVPREFIKTGEINGYKFGFVVNVDSSDNPEASTSKTVSVVKNDKFKFICIYINLVVQENLVSSFPRKVFYEIENALDNDGFPINTNIDGILDLKNANWLNFERPNSGYTYIRGLVDSNGKSPKFISQINQVNGQYSYLIFKIGLSTRVLKIDRVVGDDAIIVQGLPRDWDGLSDDLNTGGVWKTPTLISPAIEQSLSYTYYRGGIGSFIEVFESLNAKRFSDFINNEYQQTEYVTVNEDGTIDNNKFVLAVEDGVEFVKLSSLKNEVDSDKPKSYKVTADEVGKIVVKRNDEYYTILKRMNGDYLPKFRDILFFDELYPSAFVYRVFENTNIPIRNKRTLLYNRYNNMGIVFGTAYQLTGQEKIGLIPNYHYHKVNPESADSVLKLSITTDKLPVYPKIGELAIDKKDMNILNSKYEDDYYSRSLANNRSQSDFGTSNPIEKSSFMASTVMKVSDEYIISRFNTVKTNTIDELDTFSPLASREKSIAFFETDDRIFIDVYLKFALLDELIEKGINLKFNKYVDPAKSFGDITTIDDDLSKYVELNIVPRFIIGSIDLYAKESKAIQTSFRSVDDISDIDFSTYIRQSNFTFKTFTEDRLGFRLIYNKRPGYSYELIPVIKIIA